MSGRGISEVPVEGIGLDVIQATKREPRIMRYELTDFERAANGSTPLVWDYLWSHQILGRRYSHHGNNNPDPSRG